jgi:hypothetical protein
VLPDELETPPLDELELLDEELLEEELLEDPELLELPEEDELLDELELLELLLDDEPLPELLLECPWPQPASIAASSTLATSALRVDGAGRPCARSRVTGVDMVFAPYET